MAEHFTPAENKQSSCKIDLCFTSIYASHEASQKHKPGFSITRADDFLQQRHMGIWNLAERGLVTYFTLSVVCKCC